MIQWKIKGGKTHNKIKVEDVILKLQKQNEDTTNLVHAVEFIESEEGDEEILFNDGSI